MDIIEHNTYVHGLAGLINMGNTCYLNSVLQVLINLTKLRNFFISKEYHLQLIENIKNKINNFENEGDIDEISSVVQSSISYQLERLFKTIWTSKYTEIPIYKPVSFRKLIMQKYVDFNNGGQHDPPECIDTIFNLIEEEIGYSVNIEPNLTQEELITFKILDNQYEKLDSVVGEEKTIIQANLRLLEDKYPGLIKRYKQLLRISSKYKNTYSICDELFLIGTIKTLNCETCEYKKYLYDHEYRLMIPIPHDIISNEEVNDKVKNISLPFEQNKQLTEITSDDDSDSIKTEDENLSDVDEFIDDPQNTSSINVTNLKKNMAIQLLHNERKYTLDHYLDLYFKEETLEWKCSYCNINNENCCSTTKILNLPHYLIIQLKRFNNDLTKQTQFITFEESINLDKYMDSDILNHLKTSTNYRLINVINHIGEYRGGHYWTYGKNDYDNNWYSFNDEDVKPISNIVTQYAYILVYEKTQNDQNIVKI
jgi:ubiquitin C-terminal hydrolase